MTHCQLIVDDIFSGGLLQIGDQVGKEEILQLSAGLADQMTVGHGVFIVAVRLAGDGEAADLSVGSQLVEVAVNRTHGDVRHLFPGAEEDFLGGQMVMYVGLDITNQRLLFGHRITPFEIKNHS